MPLSPQLALDGIGIPVILKVAPEWRNRQTQTTQTRSGNPRVGSTPTSGIITEKEDGYKPILFFVLFRSIEPDFLSGLPIQQLP